MFDNRTAMDKAGLGRLQQRFDAVRGIGRNHFGLEIGGRMIGYCYIRKNACSSFKKMFIECSPHRALKRQDQHPIDFIRQYHRLAPGALAACDHLIFAYRDPSERTLSMFRNKFIAQTGASDISASYTRIAGQPPEAATFRSFIEGYLGRRFAQLDRHVLPQRMHLQRVCYTDAIPVQNLHAGMCRVIGPELADQYFLQPVNRTSDVPLQPVSDAADRPVQELREIYAREGCMPDNASLLPVGVAARLRKLYAMDYDIIGTVSNAACSA
ncbi:sulfotransferase family 2 domain-containing protein [Leisingera sp. MMG026]|uniref:sulfotransferase family 2 domain-containing protein n=1 Tax=Leisingera sp. MMG026 TaxID=2909982 RepID=UPI001F2209B1|nr:sulfotransferase family 2 domain-containing protein [Leisingera sp. MMG026]MCF6430610.1 sulfotransferase family protein [Leisingera sp. MMG026]